MKQSLEWLLDRRFKGTVDPQGVAGQGVNASYEGTRYRFYLPRGYTGDVRIPLIVSVHGSWGFPEPYADMWIQDANRFGFAVLAPHFDYPTFPGYDALEIGIHGTRSDLRLLDIIEQIGEHHSVETKKFYLFGHSQGGQFVTRFVMAHPERIHGAVASGAGSYVRWNPDVYFPNGAKVNPLAPDLNELDFGSLARAKLGIVLGDRELERRKTAAQQFMEDIERYALNHRIRPEVELMWVQDAGHTGAKNQPTASAFLFGR